MIYTEKTKRAMKLCYKAHHGQVDKSGLPYVHHPLHLAEQMDDEDSTIVALLHDVVEDTDYTLEDIKGMDFGDAVVEALTLLTHDPEVLYMDYIKKIATNPLATKVKLADLEHNSDITRLNHEPTEKDKQRLYKYMLARSILERRDEQVIEDGIVKRRIAPKLFSTEDGRKRMRPGISIVQAKAIGLSIKDLWRMAENGESIHVDDELLTIDNTNLEARLADVATVLEDENED